ncbi:MAG: glyceraldehyde-3-phosphate dehydrogenase, type I [Parcubacteria group bacterium Gr01-1014_48]|nr:MAG: glyceraldehyde-3-phosphate dehydrogenase, type I [Parcubacteria group bacterium Greene0416_14]TSC74052.1 MAG: glyceraldehyde-3-phosphate dehydrogenase, type I [Parcubacteria group bacterium Gr01-1014_48]TSD01159.1 MAG: glyceraldehyde-3-phosphate dehydrogenase, type I [Parcubacteria group bacterium Greene1014_15]TSD08235.1 MAG: glyceraldehyde-3-phosphate dehydrogenase, type I [Parcubacteria group bacterium Greene0714_4]
MIKVGINGFGRIGRSFFRIARERSELLVVAVNDLGTLPSAAYLLKHDTVYGAAPFSVEINADKHALIVDDKEIAFTNEKEPSDIPWGASGVDVVVESTGFFTSYEKSQAHISAGAKRVVITAPVKDSGGATVLMGINEQDLSQNKITSNASCTTNAASPIVRILHDAIGIEKALLNTVHAYTASQALVDGAGKKDLRDGRAAAQNMVPSSTGAAIAVTQAITELADKFDGISIRVPVIAGSIADITFLAKRQTSVEEVNDILRKAAEEERWQKVFAVTDEELVSSDIVGSQYASIADLTMTRVVGGDLVKVLAWYDNEMGYTHALVEHVIATSAYL